MKTIVAKIDVTKIDRSRLFEGKQRPDGTKPKYLDVVLIENKGGTDQYGNDYMICQSVSKEERERGIKGPILGNAKIMGQSTGQTTARPNSRPSGQQTSKTDDSSDVPF